MNKEVKKLKVDDIIFVGNPLRARKYCFYKVKRIEGNIAYTGFRNFNTKVYNNKFVYEYGKRQSAIYNNTYRLSNKEEALKSGADIK